MPVVGNRIKVASSSTGTGNITLGSAEDGFQTFADGGISNNDVVRYVITEGSAWEIGKGTYLTSGPTLVRTSANLLESSTGSLLNLGGSATVFVSLADVDVMQTDGGTFTGDVTFDGATAGYDIVFDRSDNALEFADNAKATFGTGNDLQISHGGTFSNITDSSNALYLQSAAVRFTNAGGTEIFATMDSTDGVQLKFGDDTKVQTTSSGVTIKGGTTSGDFTFTGASYNAVWDSSDNALEFAQNARLRFGNSNDFQLFSNGTTGIIGVINSETLQFWNLSNSSVMAKFNPDGSNELYHNNSKKFETTSTGIDVTGNITVSGTVDGVDIATRDGVLTTTTTTADAALPRSGGTMTGDIAFEGSTADDFETTVTVTDPTADRTVTLPDQTGKVMLWQNNWPDDPVSTGTYAFKNYAIGENTLSSLTTGYSNVVYGSGAGTSITSGYRNTAIGEDAFGDASSASNSTAVGERALQQITTGNPNTGFGVAALLDNRSGTNNTAVGYGSGRGVTTYGITTVGNEAGNIYTSGTKWFQTLIGNFCGDDTLGDRSTGLGAFAISDGYHTDSVAVGYDALGQSSTSSPWYNVAVGNYAGDGIWAGDNNVVIGYASDTKASTSSGAVAVGTFAVAPTYGVSVGYLAGNSYASGSLYNVLVGYRAGRDMDGGDYCVFVGYDAGEAGGTGNRNTGCGALSLLSLTTGGSNSACGMNGLRQVTEGSYNSGLGEAAGYNLTTGSNNTFLGYQAGYRQDGVTTNGLTTGSNVTCLGFEAVPSSATATNEITLGDNDISTLRCNVQTISSLSDERDKTAIEDLSYGLDFINDMRPVQFTWNRRDGSMGAKPDIGFIAQELYETELDHSSSSRTRLVNWSDPNKLEADYVRSYPILVKAVQELSAKCNALEARLAALEGA